VYTQRGRVSDLPAVVNKLDFNCFIAARTTLKVHSSEISVRKCIHLEFFTPAAAVQRKKNHRRNILRARVENK
jgi:hypothetical protein